jgi:hypothetical protein
MVPYIAVVGRAGIDLLAAKDEHSGNVLCILIRKDSERVETTQYVVDNHLDEFINTNSITNRLTEVLLVLVLEVSPGE